MHSDRSFKPLHFISAAGNQTAAPSIEVSQCSKAIVLELVNPLGALEKIAAPNRNDGTDFWEHREFSKILNEKK